MISSISAQNRSLHNFGIAVLEISASLDRRVGRQVEHSNGEAQSCRVAEYICKPAGLQVATGAVDTRLGVMAASVLWWIAAVCGSREATERLPRGWRGDYKGLPRGCRGALEGPQRATEGYRKPQRATGGAIEGYREAAEGLQRGCRGGCRGLQRGCRGAAEGYREAAEGYREAAAEGCRGCRAHKPRALVKELDTGCKNCLGPPSPGLRSMGCSRCSPSQRKPGSRHR